MRGLALAPFQYHSYRAYVQLPSLITSFDHEYEKSNVRVNKNL